MVDFDFVASDLHADLYEVADTKDEKKRASAVAKLRAENKKQNLGYTIATRGDTVFVATSKAAVSAIPASSGRGAKPFDFAAKLAEAKKKSAS